MESWHCMLMVCYCKYCQMLREAAHQRLAARVIKTRRSSGLPVALLPDEERPLAGLGADQALAWLGRTRPRPPYPRR